MSYTRQAATAADASWLGASAYSRPAYNAADASWAPSSFEVVISATLEDDGAAFSAQFATPVAAVLDAALGDDQAAFVAQWYPENGFQVVLDAQFEDDTAAFTGTFAAPVFAALSATFEADVAAFAAHHAPPIVATLSAALDSDAAAITGQFIATVIGAWSATLDADVAAVSGQFITPTVGTWASTLGNDTAVVAAHFAPPIHATIAASLGDDAASIAAHHAWDQAIDPLRTQTYYALDIDDGVLPPVRIPISSWQATLQTGRASYLQAVIPGAADVLDAINARAAGTFTIRKGARWIETGLVNESMMAEAPIQTMRVDEGPTNVTVTLSGFYTYMAGAPVTRIMADVRSRSSDAGGQRARCAVDWFLRPGDTAMVRDQPMSVAWINYYVNAQDAFMDIGERAA